jgi:hypothetical protein
MSWLGHTLFAAGPSSAAVPKQTWGCVSRRSCPIKGGGGAGKRVARSRAISTGVRKGVFCYWRRMHGCQQGLPLDDAGERIGPPSCWMDAEVRCKGTPTRVSWTMSNRRGRGGGGKVEEAGLPVPEQERTLRRSSSCKPQSLATHHAGAPAPVPARGSPKPA